MNIHIYIGYNEGLVNVKKSLKIIENKISEAGITPTKVQVIQSCPEKFEYPALDRCWEDSLGSDFYGLYIHCKGASKPDGEQFENAVAWLNYMLYGLLNNYDSCLWHLTKGADLVGSMWYRHFKGNCFWFKSNYVRNLMRPSSVNTADRYLAEYWCSQAYWWNKTAAFPKIKNLFYLPIKNDQDFLTLVNKEYIPDIYTREVCKDIAAAAHSNDYKIFDDIELSIDEYLQYRDVLDKYTNYDSKIILK
jgi:hypothetical protein